MGRTALRTLIIAVALVLATVAGGSASSDDGWLAVVRLRTDVDVPGPDIFLGDIADIDTEDTGLRERLQLLHVGRAPLPGQRRELHVATIQTRMRQQRLPVSDISVLADEPEIVVRTRAELVSGDTLMEKAREALLETASATLATVGVPGRWELTCSTPASVTVSADDPIVRVQRTSGTAPGVMVAVVDVIVAGIPARTVNVRCDAVWEQQVLVALQPLKRHDVLEGEVYDTEWRRFTSLPREGLLSTESPEGWRVTRPVSSGTVLTRTMVEPIPLVRRGDRISIVASTGGILVTAPGVAQGDGGPGEVIRVENTLSGQIVEAYVVDEQTVSALLR